MKTPDALHVRSRRSFLHTDADGRQVWEQRETSLVCSPRNCSIVICDVWDKHWCRGAAERLRQLLPRMQRVVRESRDRGVLIIHAPSETMEFYAGTTARQRALEAKRIRLPDMGPPDVDPPLPIDDDNGGCDTDANFGDVDERVWTRQDAGIAIADDVDAVTDSGEEVYRLLSQESRRHLFMMGVHTNMCILNRSFGIKNMVRWGVDVTLLRDLTDSMYDPRCRPYVNHEVGTELVIDYIEKFWCPSALSDCLLE